MAFLITGNALADDITYNTFVDHKAGDTLGKVLDGAYFSNDGAIFGDVITFDGSTAPIFPATWGDDYNALAVHGNNLTVAVTAKEIYVGSKDAGNFRGFRVIGNSNTLTVLADKFVSYTGDEVAHARESTEETPNVINLGTSDKPIGYFEAHTTWGKDDYGVAILQANEGSTVNLYADKAILDGSTSAYGGVIGTGRYGTVNVVVGDLEIAGNICGSYGLVNDSGKTAALNVTADKLKIDGDINIGSVGEGKSNYCRDTVVNIAANNATINGNINVSGNNGNLAQNTDKSTLNVEFNGDSVINGDINVKGSETNKNATVNLGGTGDMTASTGVYNIENSGNVNFTGGKWVINQWNSSDSSGNTSVASGAEVDIKATKMAVTSLDLNGTVNLDGEGVTVSAESLKAKDAVVNTNSLKNSIIATNITASNLNVNGSGAIADAIARGDAELADLAAVVKTSSGADEKSAASTVTTDEGTVVGAYFAKVNEEGQIVVDSVKEAANSTNVGLTEAASSLRLHWRGHMNDMNKRMGELRDSKGEHGVWARMARGENEHKSVTAQYNLYQLGYDEKLSSDPTWTVGAALTHSDGNSSFSKGSTDDKATGVAIYGSKLNDDGSFLDLIAKYSRLDSDVKIGAANGDYSTNGYSLSAEYGKRFTQDSGLWLEPQVELTYGYLSGAEYKIAGRDVTLDGMKSLIGRLGFALGKNLGNEKGNVYVRASYLYDFDGETEGRFSDGSVSRTVEEDLGGGWWEFGVGTNFNFSKATHLYIDLEKTCGGEIETNWQWNAGIRYSF